MARDLLKVARNHNAVRAGKFAMQGTCPINGKDFSFMLKPPSKTKGECAYCGAELRVETWEEFRERAKVQAKKKAAKKKAAKKPEAEEAPAE